MHKKRKKKGTFACLAYQNCASIKKKKKYNNQIPVKWYYTWSNRNIVYMLKCPCDIVYISQTTRPLKICINEHKSCIRRYTQKNASDIKGDENRSKYGEASVARHFLEFSHHVSDLRWQIVEEVFGNDESQIKTCLCQREVYWNAGDFSSSGNERGM